ncbi:hypothetical protein PK98_14430 [Croceibacterium mercuriale]|uniref:ATP-binding protein n=2 Tax=Croceibacterium mercuriale TaxID=1572751 RepID=A0A0B2BX44_9SPHN|nr:hypothetical protein PK98_14430 [Croceibacterium mercuriale]
MLPSSIRPSVAENTIIKVTRLFNGTLTDVLNELLQNARRAGASCVAISHHTDDDIATICVTDDGSGVEQPANLLTLGSSGWDGSTIAREDPAGMGVFSLAGREVTITSCHAAHDSAWRVTIPADGWTGETDLVLHPAEHPIGTSLRFSIEQSPSQPKAEQAIAAVARFFPLPVIVNGIEAKREGFLDSALHRTSWRGTTIGVHAGSNSWKEPSVNFHGLTINHKLVTVSESLTARHYHARVDIGDTAGLQLLLPARKEFVVNEAYAELLIACERAIYEHIALQPSHRLSFEDWQRAAELGVTLPEADPVLKRWAPATSHSEYGNPSLSRQGASGEEIPVDAGTVIVLGDDAFVEQPFDRALVTHPMGPYLAAEHSSYAGFAWYDAVARLQDVEFVVTTVDGQILSATEMAADQFKADLRAQAIACRWNIATAAGDVLRQETTPTDIALFVDDDYWWENLEALRIAWTDTRALKPEELVNLLECVCFSPSDDSAADSWDTQHEAFLRDARSRANTLLLSADEAIVANIRDLIFANRWRLPQGRTVTIAIGQEAVAVELGDLPEAA